jgi:hypothetical protein
MTMISNCIVRRHPLAFALDHEDNDKQHSWLLSSLNTCSKTWRGQWTSLSSSFTLAKTTWEQRAAKLFIVVFWQLFQNKVIKDQKTNGEKKRKKRKFSTWTSHFWHLQVCLVVALLKLLTSPHFVS